MIRSSPNAKSGRISLPAVIGIFIALSVAVFGTYKALMTSATPAGAAVADVGAAQSDSPYLLAKAGPSAEATVGRTERSEVPAVATANHERHERHETHEKKTSDSSAATLSSVSWSPTSASSPVKTDLTPIEQIHMGERVLAESPTGNEDL